MNEIYTIMEGDCAILSTKDCNHLEMFLKGFMKDEYKEFRQDLRTGKVITFTNFYNRTVKIAVAPYMG